MHIQPVILAGGSGVRLWPASRRDHPKQLLALHGSLSLLQDTALRLEGLPRGMVIQGPMVVTNEEYRFLVLQQLQAVGIAAPRIIMEPVGRNTAPALTLAALAAEVPGIDPLLLVMPSDHVMADLPAFQEAVEEAATQAATGAFVTFGIVPHRAETSYGYIQVGDRLPAAKTARALAGFREKPDLETARRFLAEGSFLWNSGIFMVQRSVWLAAITACSPEIAVVCRASFEACTVDGPFVAIGRQQFSECPSDSVDYAVLEKLELTASTPTGPVEAVVIPLDAGWSDAGSWEALWEVSPKDACGNATKGETILEDVHDSLIHGERRSIAVAGCRDLIVVDTEDALLVAAKSHTANMRTLVDRVQEHDPTLTTTHPRVHRPWGRFRTLDEGDGYLVKHIVVEPGGVLSLQLHHHRAEHWVVVKGTADITCGDDHFRLAADEATYIPKEAPHRVENRGPEPLHIIEVQWGDHLDEADIVRLEDRYGRT